MPRLLLLPVLALPAVLIAAQPVPPNPAPAWKFDVLMLKNGAKLEGLILSETPETILFQSVLRLPGRPTVTLTGLITRPEIDQVRRLSTADRAVLKDRLAELDQNGAGERTRMETLELVTTDWPGKPGAAKRYESDYFTLVSTGSDEFTRRSAVRLEQLYTAFTRFLPPTVKNGRPTQVMFATDHEEYKNLLGPLGAPKLLNPAVYDPRGNRVLCGSNLRELGTELQTARIHHSQQLVTLEKYEESVRKLYRPPELKRYLEAADMERKRVYRADRENGEKFDRSTSRIFAILFHEAFHAYAGAFLYVPLKPEEVKAGKGTGELPRWLNEGLAQVFETAVVEVGELRADTPDRARLERVQNSLRGKAGERLVPLGELLVTGKDTFLASHADEKGVSERAYLTSWALAFYLTFERKLLGTVPFQKYLTAINTGGDPRSAFAELVKEDLAVFEKEWHAYLLRLRPDGTMKK